MKKIILALFVFGIFFSCDTSQEEAPVLAEEAVEFKTPAMLKFEKAINEYGQAGPVERELALTRLISNSREYLLENGKTVPEDATDTEVLNTALDVHLAKVNELRTHKTN